MQAYSETCFAYLRRKIIVGLPNTTNNRVVMVVKKICLPMQETQKTQVQSLNQEDPLEEGMATHPSIPAWRIPWTEEPGGL